MKPRRANTFHLLCLTCHGLEQVGAVLHVGVSVEAVPPLTQSSALLVGGEVFLQGVLKVFGCVSERVVAIEALPQQKLSLRKDSTLPLPILKTISRSGIGCQVCV